VEIRLAASLLLALFSAAWLIDDDERPKLDVALFMAPAWDAADDAPPPPGNRSMVDCQPSLMPPEYRLTSLRAARLSRSAPDESWDLGDYIIQYMKKHATGHRIKKIRDRRKT
jgi:hypothetical protein